MHPVRRRPLLPPRPLALFFGASVWTLALLPAHAQPEAGAEANPAPELSLDPPAIPDTAPPPSGPLTDTPPAPESPTTATPPAEAAPEVPPDLTAPATTRVPGERDDAPAPALPAPTVTPATGPTPLGGRVLTAPNSQLSADNFTLQGGVVVASANPGNQVQFSSGPFRLFAGEVRLDSAARTVNVPGEVRVERETRLSRRLLDARASRRSRYETTTVVESLRGRDFSYNFGTRQGGMDDARVIMSSLNINANALRFNGDRYEAQNVVLRPGGLTPEEERIYGRPPFSLRAHRVIITAPQTGDTPAQVRVTGAAFYIGGVRLFPVPSYVLSRSTGGRDPQAFSLSPRLSFSSADRVLLTTQLAVPFDRTRPDALSAVADLGYSQRVGFRGGLHLEARGSYGRLSLGGLVNDVVTTQLTNRIELDRLPEVSYRTPTIHLFPLPGGRRAGLVLSGIAGSYRETETGGGDSVDASRLQGGVTLTTRAIERDGPYVELFARTARYGGFHPSYDYSGFEVGYTGQLLPRILGQVSYRSNNINGETPFRFDQVEIAREVRATFDVSVSRRYLLPFDLRYDLGRDDLRDARFGVLRSYKTFAYGATYRTAAHDLRLEYRQAF